MKKTQINNIINEKVVVTANNKRIQRIIRDCYKRMYAKKMDNLEKKWTIKIQCPFMIKALQKMGRMETYLS